MEDKKVAVKVRGVSVSPQKLRLVADVVRGMRADKALDVLHLMRKKGALHLEKALKSAVTSAKDLHSLEADGLVISKLTVDEGQKRRKPRFGSRGRVSMLVRRLSQINLEVKAK